MLEPLSGALIPATDLRVLPLMMALRLWYDQAETVRAVQVDLGNSFQCPTDQRACLGSYPNRSKKTLNAVGLPSSKRSLFSFSQTSCTFLTMVMDPQM